MTETAYKIYTGTFTHTVDNQSRVTIPSIWRGPKTSESAEFYVVQHPNDRVLLVMPPREFSVFVDQCLGDAPITERTRGDFSRILLGQKTHYCVIDAQGRISLSEEMLNYAELKRGEEAVLTGLGRIFEISNKEQSVQLNHRAQLNYEYTAARLGVHQPRQ